MYTHLWSLSLPLTSGECQLRRVVMMGADSSTVGFCSTAHDTSGSPLRGPSAEAAIALQVRDWKHMAGFNLEWKRRQRLRPTLMAFVSYGRLRVGRCLQTLKNKLCFFYPVTVSNYYLSLRIADVSLISNDVETQKNMQSWNISKEPRSWKVKTTVHWRDVLLGLFCELYHSRNTSNTAGDAWSGVSD